MRSPRRFVLNRIKDVSGVSGTGIIVEGIEYSDRTVAVRWLGDYASTTVWSNIETMMAVHGHGDATEILWIDKEPTWIDIVEGTLT